MVLRMPHRVPGTGSRPAVCLPGFAVLTVPGPSLPVGPLVSRGVVGVFLSCDFL